MDKKGTLASVGPSGRDIVLWAAGSVVLVVALAVVGWYVVRPVAEVRRVLRKHNSGMRLAISFQKGPPEVGSLNDRLAWLAKHNLPSIGRGIVQISEDRWIDTPMLAPLEAIGDLGGQDRAAKVLRFYLRMPEYAAPDKDLAAFLLEFSESEPGLPAL